LPEPQEVLAATDAMRRFAAEHVSPSLKPADRLSALQDALFGRKGLGLSYGSHETRTAAETFEAASGNCISFTNLFVVLAREVGLEAFFSEVDDVLTREQQGETLISNKHMFVTVEIENAHFTVDFATTGKTRYHDVRRITDRRAVAHYFNNLGVETLLEDGGPAAVPYLERAVHLDPDFAAAWINLGVAQRRSARWDLAELAYRRAIDIDRFELAAFSNLAYLLEAWHREDEAARIRQRIGGYRKRNPFRSFGLGNKALAAGDLEKAAKHFQEAVRRVPEEARFHFALGDALYRLGRLEEARESLSRAVELAETEAEREHYTRALESLTVLLAQPEVAAGRR
jgi:Flp pilus assembly protein TadD